MTTKRKKTAKSKIAKPASQAAANKPVTRTPKSRKAGKRMRRVKVRGHQTKQALILSLLKRPDGASIDDLTEATGWQVHSVRAALTGLRKKGQEIVRTRDDAGVTRYRIAGEG